MGDQNDLEKKAEEMIKQEAKQKAEKIAKDLTKKVTKLIAKTFLQIASALFSFFGGIFGVLIIIILIIIGTFTAISNFLSDAFPGEERSYLYLNNLVWINNTNYYYAYEINSSEFISQVEEYFEKNNMTPTAFGISEDYSELRKFLEAEIATLYPDLRAQGSQWLEPEENEIVGGIHFSRTSYPDGIAELQYTSFEDFSKRMAMFGIKIKEDETQEQLYFDLSEKESNYDILLKDYFTMDETGYVYFATIESRHIKPEYSDYADEENHYHSVSHAVESETFDVGYSKVNYRSAIEKYSVPFELLLAMQIITKNSGYTTALADMVKHTNIVFEIYDEYYCEETTYKWTSKFRASRHYHYLGSDWSDPNMQPYSHDEDLGPVEIGSATAQPYEKMTNSYVKTVKTPRVRLIDSWIAYVEQPRASEGVITVTDEDPIFSPDEDWLVVPQNYHNFSLDVDRTNN